MGDLIASVITAADAVVFSFLQLNWHDMGWLVHTIECRSHTKSLYQMGDPCHDG